MQVECRVTAPEAAANMELRVYVGASTERLVGGQTLTVSAVEPSRVPKAFKVLWGAGQPEPAKWYPGICVRESARARVRECVCM
jgi:hypothetical protein